MGNKFINNLLFFMAVLGILFVLSGYKKSFEFMQKKNISIFTKNILNKNSPEIKLINTIKPEYLLHTREFFQGYEQMTV